MGDKSYKPGTGSPRDVEQLRRYLTRELRRIATAVNSPETKGLDDLKDVNLQDNELLEGQGIWYDADTETWRNRASYTESFPTGLADGGELNIVAGEIEALAGAGLTIDAYTEPLAPPTAIALRWNTIQEPITAAPAVAGSVAWFAIENSGIPIDEDIGGVPFFEGRLVQYAQRPNPTVARQQIFLGIAVHNGNEWGEASNPKVLNQSAETLREVLVNLTGPSTIIQGGRVDEEPLFKLSQEEGTIWEQNRNWHRDKSNPNRELLEAVNPIQFRYTNRDFSTVGVLTDTVTPGFWDNNGTVEPTPGPANATTIQRLYLDIADNYWMLYGQEVYQNFLEANANLLSDNPVVPLLLQNAIFLGWVVAEKAKTDWDPSEAIFIPATTGQTIAGAGAPITDHDNLNGITPDNHHNQVHLFWGTDHSDVDAADTPTDGQVPVFRSVSGLWQAETLDLDTVWGEITGNIANQTDLQNALDAKTNQTDFVAHTANTNIHFADAPADGVKYARINNAWAPADSGGGGGNIAPGVNQGDMTFWNATAEEWVPTSVVQFDGSSLLVGTQSSFGARLAIRQAASDLSGGIRIFSSASDDYGAYMAAVSAEEAATFGSSAPYNDANQGGKLVFDDFGLGWSLYVGDNAGGQIQSIYASRDNQIYIPNGSLYVAAEAPPDPAILFVTHESSGNPLFERRGDNSGGIAHSFRKARGALNAPREAVQDGDTIGGFAAWGYDGVVYAAQAQIAAVVTGPVDVSDVPVSLDFRTGGTSSSSNRLRIQPDGVFDFYGNTLDNIGSANIINTLTVGVEDDQFGYIILRGRAPGTNTGGVLQMDTAADWDGTYAWFALQVTQDLAVFGTSVDAVGGFTYRPASSRFEWAGNRMIDIGGLSLGADAVSDPQDLSRHLDLWGGTTGLSITANTLNYNAISTGSGSGNHDFYAGTVASPFLAMRVRSDYWWFNNINNPKPTVYGQMDIASAFGVPNWRMSLPGSGAEGGWIQLTPGVIGTAPSFTFLPDGRIIGVTGEPTTDDGVANKAYVDSKVPAGLKLLCSGRGTSGGASLSPVNCTITLQGTGLWAVTFANQGSVNNIIPIAMVGDGTVSQQKIYISYNVESATKVTFLTFDDGRTRQTAAIAFAIYTVA